MAWAHYHDRIVSFLHCGKLSVKIVGRIELKTTELSADRFNVKACTSTRAGCHEEHTYCNRIGRRMLDQPFLYIQANVVTKFYHSTFSCETSPD